MAIASSARAVTVRAHAKINLDLRVLGTRPDGFHELRTVFQAISLHDTLECVPRDGPFAIECEAAGVPLDRSNLVWRAAEALWRSLRASGSVRDVLVRLEKRIPLQAGLGGGSADAAAALLGLAHAWRVPVRPISSRTWQRRLAPTFRSFWPAGRRSGSAAATRSIRSPICRVTGSCC